MLVGSYCVIGISRYWIYCVLVIRGCLCIGIRHMTSRVTSVKGSILCL